MDDKKDLKILEKDLDYLIKRRKCYSKFNIYNLTLYSGVLVYLLIYIFIFWLIYTSLSGAKSEKIFVIGYISIWITTFICGLIKIAYDSVITFLINKKIVNDPKEFEQLLNEINHIKEEIKAIKKKKIKENQTKEASVNSNIILLFWKKRIKPFLIKVASFFKSKSVIESLVEDYVRSNSKLKDEAEKLQQTTAEKNDNTQAEKTIIDPTFIEHRENENENYSAKERKNTNTKSTTEEQKNLTGLKNVDNDINDSNRLNKIKEATSNSKSANKGIELKESQTELNPVRDKKTVSNENNYNSDKNITEQQTKNQTNQVTNTEEKNNQLESPIEIISNQLESNIDNLFEKKSVTYEKPKISSNRQSVKKIDAEEYAARNKSKQEIGLAGELFVLECERKKLIGLGRADLSNKIQHVSKDIGDGLGYDIISFDQFGNEIFIEVKTTSSNYSADFYLTNSELNNFSKLQRFNLYRVYDFNEDTKNGNLFIIDSKEKLESYFSTVPHNFRVMPNKLRNE